MDPFDTFLINFSAFLGFKLAKFRIDLVSILFSYLLTKSSMNYNFLIIRFLKHLIFQNCALSLLALLIAKRYENKLKSIFNIFFLNSQPKIQIFNGPYQTWKEFWWPEWMWRRKNLLCKAAFLFFWRDVKIGWLKFWI